MNYWDILGLAPTKDLGAIRRAYCRRSAQYNPEDHPEEFLAVRQAYEQATAYARGQEPSAATPEWIAPPLPCSEKTVQPNAAQTPEALRSGTSARRKILLHPRRWTILRSCTAPNSAEIVSSGIAGLPLRNFSRFSRPLVYEGAA